MTDVELFFRGELRKPDNQVVGDLASRIRRAWMDVAAAQAFVTPGYASKAELDRFAEIMGWEYSFVEEGGTVVVRFESDGKAQHALTSADDGGVA